MDVNCSGQALQAMELVDFADMSQQSLITIHAICLQIYIALFMHELEHERMVVMPVPTARKQYYSYYHVVTG
jgi:hypothetical protein